MSCQSRKFDRRNSLTSAFVVPLCLMLSACGGGGGGSSHAENIPPPPPPPAPPPPPPVSDALLKTISGYSLANSLDVQTSWLSSPAARAGNYDVIGRLTLTPGSGNPTSYRTILPGDLTFNVGGSGSGGFRYTLSGLGGILPNGLNALGPTSIVGSWDINPSVAYFYSNPNEDYRQALGQRLTAFDKADNGTETKLFSYDYLRGSISSTTSLGSGKNLSTTFDYDIGYSYVAMGEWSWRVVDLDGTAAGDFGDLLFVDGDRTPTSGNPVSGQATYDAHTLALLSSKGTPGIPFTLTADFGQRTISALISQDYRYNASAGAGGEPILGIHVSGNAPFSNDGLFDIGLSGTVNYSYSNSQATPTAESVTGDMNGAFFGPHAEEVGGVFDLGRADGTLLVQDAFVGRQR